MSAGTHNMRLDSENRRVLGVCAGIANWLDVPVTLVRIVFIICAIAWPPLIIAYFVIYFCVDKDFTPDRIRDYFNDSETASHFRRVDYRKPIYRNQRDKRIAGVCAGIADYLEVSAFSVRLVTLLSFLLFGPFTFWAYVICWFVFEPDPYYEGEDGSSWQSRHRRRREARRQRRDQRRRAHNMRRNKVRKSYVNEEEQVHSGFDDTRHEPASDMGAESADSSASYYSRKQCTQLYSELEQRLREMEAFMTSKRFRLHCEIKRI